MAGFDNGTLNAGITTQVKQFGPILRGNGPPVPQAGVVGDLYIDNLTDELYEKRANNETDPWGHYLFVVPNTYAPTLNWFSSYAPDATFGKNGEYCMLWGGYPNYGLQPSIFGPFNNGWPNTATAVAVTLNTLYTGIDGHAI